ncbi:MAG: rhodanese-like domain-containing protein [Gammaproteobacteria bacterium]|nr:rhodanese-like domain-containing protein [Gammaproteobacteria bacterium]
MNELLDFLLRYPWLSSAALLLLMMIVFHEFRRLGAASLSLGPQAAVMLMNRGATVVDVRSQEAFERAHLLGARHIPSGEVAERAEQLPQDKPVLLYCDAGMSSARVAGQLRQAGLAEVYNLAGGIGGWQRENLPVVSGKE